MRKCKKNLIMAVGAAMLATVSVSSAWAAENREKISSISLTISSSFEAGSEDGDVSVTSGSDHYSVKEVEIVNDDGEWQVGDKPKVEIVLEADDDYYFGSISSSKTSLKGDDADFVSAKRSDSNSTLTVTVRLGEVEGTYDLDNVEWLSDEDPVAVWEDEEGVGSYRVRLYRDGSSVGETITTSNRYYDFGSKITRTGYYSFKVRSYKSSSKSGDWFESGDLEVDETMLSKIMAGNYATSYSSTGTGSSSSSGTTSSVPASGPAAITAGWQLDNVGWWYRYADGTYPTNGWLQLNNVWYCFDDVGYMRTGWILAGDGNYYYCDPSSGAMLTNAWTPDNYYVDANGRWVQNAKR